MIEAGHYGPAVKRLQSMIEENDRNAYAHFLLGTTYHKQKKKSDAIIEYRKVLRIGKFTNKMKEEMVRTRLGKLYLELGSLDEAKKEYLILTRLDPANSNHYYQVGLLFKNAGMFDKALNYFRQATQINPAHADAFLNEGIISYQHSKIIEAKNARNLVLRPEPENFWPL